MMTGERSVPRVLLSTAWGPFPVDVDGADLTDVYQSRFTRNQGVYTFESRTPYLASHLIARNIRAHTTVLDWPTREMFEQEIERDYDIVGIGFQGLAVERVLEMASLVRQRSPQSRIVLGGYGITCLGEIERSHPETSDLFDDLCRGEGVSFFRRLLNQAADAPLDLTLPYMWVYPFRLRAAALPVGVIVGGFGCRRRCEFCNTAAFHGRHVQIASGRDVYEALRRYVQADPKLRYFALYDEDFLDNTEAFETFSELMQGDPELLSHVGVSILCTMRNVQKVGAERLIRAGIMSVWLGVESRYAHMEKLCDVDPGAVFEDLHRHGIKTTGSMIVGLDCQNASNVADDIDRFVALAPTFAQIACLVPSPGTPLWDRMTREGRLRLDRWSDQHLYAEALDYRGFAPGEVRVWTERAYDQLLAQQGPAVLRAAEVALAGLQFCRRSPDPVMQRRAEFYRRGCEEIRPSLGVHRLFLRTAHLRRRAARLRANYGDALGPPSVRTRLTSLLLAGWLGRNWLWERFGWLRPDPPRPQVRLYGERRWPDCTGTPKDGASTVA